MNKLTLVRIDDRLIHGQVMTAWLKQRPSKRVIIIDDVVANDEFNKQILEMAAPKDLIVEILNQEDGLNRLLNLEADKTMLLVKSPNTLRYLYENGVEFEEIVVGGMGINGNRKTFYKNLAADKKEIESLRFLKEHIGNVYIQVIPSQKKINLEGKI